MIDQPTASVEALPLVKWDPRVGKHRAPAMAYAAIRAALDGATWGDQVLAPQPSRPYESSIPTLRPYQELALDAWEARARRGVIALLTGAGKSRIGAAAIAKTKLRTLVLVPTRVLRALVGSTANTATRFPSPMSRVPSASKNVLLSAPGTLVNPMRIARPACGKSRVSSSSARPR